MVVKPPTHLYTIHINNSYFIWNTLSLHKATFSCRIALRWIDNAWWRMRKQLNISPYLSFPLYIFFCIIIVKNENKKKTTKNCITMVLLFLVSFQTILWWVWGWWPQTTVKMFLQFTKSTQTLLNWGGEYFYTFFLFCISTLFCFHSHKGAIFA